MSNLREISSDSKRSGKTLSRRLLGWVLQSLLLLVLVFVVHLWQTRHVVTGVAPPLSGQLLEGGRFSLSSEFDTPLVVHFWATWCPLCRLELDNIAALHPEYQVITVAMMSGSDAEIIDFLRINEVNFPVISDPQGKLAHAWGVTGVPATFVLDKEKRIRFVEVGYTTSLGLRWRIWWSQQKFAR